MIDTPVHELDRRIQQLSLGDQLWLMEKLAQHIRVKANDVVDPQPKNGEPYSNGSGIPPSSKAAHAAIEELEQEDEMADESAIFSLNADSPLYQDLLEIRNEIREGKFKLYTHEEVWGE